MIAKSIKIKAFLYFLVSDERDKKDLERNRKDLRPTLLFKCKVCRRVTFPADI